ncbi:hypothetical protein [Agrobacterium genomosp. 2]|uniref:Uncharacterized protein n=1 Tax=Agrobacterium genomosp. 2 str. CFBP 5494 TaxID=1183436 RepID=A0A9W5B2E5_9HYPH|nr:hypothetical protein [Agrobacterium genomosp. 2]CUW93619.1 hypothetical protein AGR2A_Cc70060 [Agrobacterium genomosp. 2 str. CFBP 5494]
MARKASSGFGKLSKLMREAADTQEWLRSVREAQAAGLPQPPTGSELTLPRRIGLTTDDIVD